MALSDNAIITKIKVRKHPNADRLQLGYCMGFQVVVGLDVQNDDLGIFFPEGLQLSQEYCDANNLIRKIDPETKQNIGGLFDVNRRVRSQKLRGEKSEGYFASLSSLDFAGSITLTEGIMVSSVNNIPICNKYYTPKTLAARKKNKEGNAKKQSKMFIRHFETPQYRFNKHQFNEGDLIVITEKLHGTSARVGHVLMERKLSFWERLAKKLGIRVDPYDWEYQVGSRNCTVGPNDKFRYAAAQPFIGYLKKGETVYYEIVGYEPTSKPIMQTVDASRLSDKSIAKKYGNLITYHYGTTPGQFDIYVYRITMTNEDGFAIDLSWNDVKERCKQLNVKYVPEITEPFLYEKNESVNHENFLEEIVTKATDGVSTVCFAPLPREGVVVRVDSGLNIKSFKNKSFVFGLLEGYIKDNPDYVDTEEVA